MHFALAIGERIRGHAGQIEGLNGIARFHG
jgi:hypothetical protein